MNKELLEKLKTIHDHFGNTHQRNKLLEECLELLESGEEEEYADVFVLAVQIYMNSPKMRTIVEQKVDRTLDRIESKYYEGE